MQFDLTDDEITWLLTGLRMLEDQMMGVLDHRIATGAIGPNERLEERLAHMLDPKPTVAQVHTLYERLAGLDQKESDA